MNRGDEEDPYFDFSEDEDVAHDFRASGVAEWLESTAWQAQTAIRRRNPTTGMRELLAAIMVGLAFQSRQLRNQLRLVNILLTIIAVLLGIIVALPVLLLLGSK